MGAKKIWDTKNNISPGVDGIPPKLVLKIVEQIRIPLATVFRLSVGGEWFYGILKSKHRSVSLKTFDKQV